MNAPLRAGGAPNPDDEYLIYQTLVGAWPLEAERLRDYMTKAMREAKVDTDWVEPDEAYEGAVTGVHRRRSTRSAAFVADLEAFADAPRPARRGRRRSARRSSS